MIFARCFFGLIVLTLAGSVSIAAEADKYPSGVESILSSISGVVSATQQNIELGRSVDRLTQIRRTLNRELASNFSTNGKVSLSELSRSALLCDARGPHAVLIANRAYLATLTTEVERVATPGEIKTLLDAIKLIFQDYSIDVAYSGQKEQAKLRNEAIERCKNEMVRLNSAFYSSTGGPIVASNSSASTEELVYAGADGVGEVQVAAFASLTLFQTLLDAINAIEMDPGFGTRG